MAARCVQCAVACLKHPVVVAQCRDDPNVATPAEMAAPAAPAATTAGADVSATTGVQLIASPPVPDTPENRAKYGGPMSHAGRHTKPAGN